MSELDLKYLEQRDMTAPRIEIPPELFSMDDDLLAFILHPPSGGPVRATVNYCFGAIECKGSTEALTHLGLFRLEWAPGPNNPANRTTQHVLFTPEGAALVVGRFYRRNNIECHPWLAIIKQTHGYLVRLALTGEQKNLVADFLKQKKTEEPGRAMAPPNGVEDCQALGRGQFVIASDAVDNVHSLVDLSHYGARYSRESEARILHAIAELREAFRCAVVKPMLVNERKGNVVYWPGRGTVPAVSQRAG